MKDLSEHAGYVGHAIYEPAGARIVVYVAHEQGIDVDGRYAIVCELHGSIAGDTNKRRALRSTRCPEFCEECMSVDLNVTSC